MFFDAVIVGAGLTGLKQAIFLNGKGTENVLVTDYEAKIGGFLQGLANPDIHTQETIREAQGLPYAFWLNSTVTNIESTGELHTLYVQRADGLVNVRTKKVIIATGSLEKPRGANLIPGTRPVGEMTPFLALGMLKRGYLPGLNPFIVINNHASREVANRLEENPICQVHERNEEDINIIEIKGNPRVTEVVVKEKESGKEKVYTCDSFIYNSGIIPNTSFIKDSKVILNKEQFICTDITGSTNIPGLYAVGECAVQIL